MLEARKVTFHYGRVQALAAASLRVDAGELVALLGPNGAGKTTTLRVLSGLVTPSEGSVLLDEQDVTGRPAEYLATQGVAHIPDNRGVFPRLTVEQNLLVGLYGRRRERPRRAPALEEALEHFPSLRPRLRARAGVLSGGEQQMLALARALVGKTTRPARRRAVARARPDDRVGPLRAVPHVARRRTRDPRRRAACSARVAVGRPCLRAREGYNHTRRFTLSPDQRPQTPGRHLFGEVLLINRYRPRRAVAIVLVSALAFVPLAGSAATSAEPDVERVIVQGAGLASAAVVVGNLDPDVDVWPMYSESSIDNQSSHGLSGAIWPGFLVDAFFFLYGVHPEMRAGLGISETQWPNPPHTARAESTGFLLANFADGCASVFGPESCAQAFEAFGTPPGALGVSESESKELSSKGTARGARFDIPGLLEAAEARSHTSSVFKGGKTVVESVFTARDVTIGGDLHIDVIEARSVANAAGDPDSSDGESTLRVVGARFGDTPVVIDDQGLHAQGDENSTALNEALASSGIEVKASQGRTTEDDAGEFVDTATGGLQIHVLRERMEETFPPELLAQRDALCAAAERNALNQEITRIRVDQPNPLYGLLPIPGIPERAQIEQSIPPPLSCPFLNRTFDFTLALGFTNASARLSPLPDIDVPDLAPSGLGTDAVYEIFPPLAGEVAPSSVLGSISVPSDEATLAAAPAPTATDEEFPRWVRIIYGLIALLALVAIAFRFVLRAASAP